MKKTPGRKIEMAKRREKQRAQVPTDKKKIPGKYIPAGPSKNLKPHNR